MSPVDKELVKVIRKVRDRLHAAAIINHMLIGTAAALCLGIAIVAAARIIPIFNIYLSILKLIGAALLTAFIFSSFRTPKDAYAALKVDSFGLKERTITALELVGDQSSFAVLEKKDALRHLQAIDYKKRISLKPDKKYLVICLVLMSVLALSGFIPNPMAEKAAELHKQKTRIAEQQKKTDELIEKVKSNPKLSEEQKKELEKTLSELKKELRSAMDEKEINKALGRTEKKLEYIKDKYALGDDLSKIAEAFSKHDMTKALADMIKSGDPKVVKDNLKQMADALKKLTPEEKQALAEELSKLAQEVKNNPELSNAFSELAQKLAAGELGDISSELGELNRSISELMGNENVRSAITELTKELEAAGTSRSSNQQGQQGQDGEGHQGQGNTPGGNGQGKQPGGDGQGDGQGSGAGSGTGMGNENQTPIPPAGSGISKKDGSIKKDGEYEKIFTPQTLGGEGETSNLSGNKGEGGNVEQVITDKSQTVRGSSVPYNQVVGQYRERAMENVNASDIPPGMKDMVKEYFTSLEE